MKHVNKDLNVNVLGPNCYDFGFIKWVFFHVRQLPSGAFHKCLFCSVLFERQQNGVILKGKEKLPPFCLLLVCIWPGALQPPLLP